MGVQVGNIYRNNTVEYHPHACFVGGGDFEDGVDNLFESNTLHVCAFETLDACEHPARPPKRCSDPLATVSWP